MTSPADWLVIAGFLLCVLGVALRVVIMMRSCDAIPANAAPWRDGTCCAYRRFKPKGRLPLAMWVLLRPPCSAHRGRVSGISLRYSLPRRRSRNACFHQRPRLWLRHARRHRFADHPQITSLF